MAGSTPSFRLLLAAALVSAWLVALLVGWSLEGGVHLALVAAVAVFPWRTARR